VGLVKRSFLPSANGPQDSIWTFSDWEKAAKDLVAALRSEAGRNPHDRALTELIGELSTRSEPFRQWWASHNVRELGRHARTTPGSGRAAALLACASPTSVAS
jgi:anti-sigma factor RsiW